MSLLLLAAGIVSACTSQDTPGDTRTGGANGSGGSVATGGMSQGAGGTSTGGSSQTGGRGGKGGTAAVGAAVGGRGGSAGAGEKGGAGGARPSFDAAVDAEASSDAHSASDATSPDGGAADAMTFPGTNNPVLPGVFADPSVVLFDGTFYIYPTTDGFADWGATSFSVFSSTDLVKWSNRGVILNVAADLKWATGHAWAPSIARVGDTYYFYFTADNQIGVATSSSPLGPFKDALGKPLIAARQYGVTSIDDDGQAYLSFGNSGLRVAKLNRDMISFAGTPTDISPAGTSGVVVEGSALFKRKGTYYLQWSEGDTRKPTYRVAYGRASSPFGPFTRLAVILEQDTTSGILGPGGSTVLGLASRDEFYMAYHRFKIPGGDGTHRETCIDRLFFNADGTLIPVKPTLQGLQAAVLP